MRNVTHPTARQPGCSLPLSAPASRASWTSWTWRVACTPKVSSSHTWPATALVSHSQHSPSCHGRSGPRKAHSARLSIGNPAA